jgi:murein DD-endopeptidase MepM/ murein hydrolase activator NlpD
MMRKSFVVAVFLAMAFITLRSNFAVVENSEPDNSTSGVLTETSQNGAEKPKEYREITGNIKKGETLFDIFKKYKLDLKDLFRLKEASADIHKLRKLSPDRPYKIIVDENDQINSFVYWIDDDTILNIKSTEEGFCAEKIPVQYERRIHHIGGVIKDNLISSMSEGKGNLMLALQLSDIFAWDIDFSTDIRNDDVFKIVVEGLYLNGEFKKYGEILSAEFVNKGETFSAYRFENDGRVDYYSSEGKSLRKAFLKAPLSFRRISSYFSRGRYHPVLKIYRPHHGLDYAAPTGTPVSAAGDGAVLFAGRKGQYGNLIIVRHSNGYKTYYGHLSRIGKGVRKGTRVDQGEVIGYVGATGLATGPHLHYEMRVNNRPINPLSLKIPHGKAIPASLMADFRKFKNEMDVKLASIPAASYLLTEKKEETIPHQKEG